MTTSGGRQRWLATNHGVLRRSRKRASYHGLSSSYGHEHRNCLVGFRTRLFRTVQVNDYTPKCVSVELPKVPISDCRLNTVQHTNIYSTVICKLCVNIFALVVHVYRFRRHDDGFSGYTLGGAYVAQCMSWRSVIVPSNRFKQHDLAVTCLYRLWILTWQWEYVLLHNVLNIKCNKVLIIN